MKLIYKKARIILKQGPALSAILIISLLVRLIFAMSAKVPILVSDSPTYLDGAKYLYEHLYIDMYRPPVYLLGIIATSLLFGWGPQSLGIIYLQTALSVISILIAYDICRSLTNNRVFTYLTCLMIGSSISIFGWDFVIMSENFSIFFLTLTAWLLIKFFNTKNFKYLTVLNIAVFLLFFTKPFFLVYPVLIFIIVLIRYWLARDLDLKRTVRITGIGLLVIYTCAISYSTLNHVQNNYFGFSAVGNVNSFGKVLQYHMEELGDNENLKRNISYAYSAAAEKDLVDGDYLEPWYFIMKYGYSEENYREVGEFASYIIKHHPIKYTIESIKLMGKIFFNLPPYRDYIAISAIQQNGSAAGFMDSLIQLYERFDFLYCFMLLGILDIFYSLFFDPKAFQGRIFIIMILVFIVFYHYAVGIFFSYGDYCRLLAPSYIIMYILMNYYVYKTIVLISRLLKRLLSFKRIAVD